MRMFDEVVNDITKDGYCVELNAKEMRCLFESIPRDLRWEGTYWGWDQHGIWQGVCEEVHKYMQARESC